MSATGFTVQFTNSANQQQTAALEGLGLLEGGELVAPIKFSFKSHGPSECMVRLPAVTPDAVAKIPFESPVVVFYKNAPVFQGRRINRPGAADPRAPYVEYCFQDAWYDFGQITFKQAWFGGAYQPATLSGTTVTFANAQLGQSANATQMLLYAAAAGAPVMPGTVVNIVSWTDATHAVISGSFSGTVGFATLLYTYPDVVLFQYRPTDPYQKASQVTQFYITTGAQLQEILNFAIAQGVAVQYVAAELNANLNLNVPWYPVRAAKCAEAIKHCMRWHPDCFTEIDYGTTPPTFHVRKRNPGAGQTGLVQITLPYEATDSQGRRHLTSDVNPRPELVPTRIGIFYRVVTSGYVLAFPKDVYPANAPDGLRAFDYSLDLQGPRISQNLASIITVPFDPGNSANGIAWWLRKCPHLKSPDVASLQMTDREGNPGAGNLTVKDDAGNNLDYVGTYAWELVSGSVEFWFSGIQSVMATISTFFNYWQTALRGAANANSTLVEAHPTAVRVKLVNTASVQESFTQFLTTGEAIPVGLAQSVYAALQQLQYNLTHKILETPWSGSFVKPGLNGINLSGDDPEWTSMNATVQGTEYTLRCDANGNAFAEYSVKCGPVEHLEPGQLVELFNIFAHRDLLRIDPWERITGLTNPSSSISSGGDTAAENSSQGAPKQSLHGLVSLAADANGNFTVAQIDARASGIRLYKWDGVTLNGDGTPALKAGQGQMVLDLSQIASGDLATIGQFQFRKFGTDSSGNPLYLVASGVGSIGAGGGNVWL